MALLPRSLHERRVIARVLLRDIDIGDGRRKYWICSRTDLASGEATGAWVAGSERGLPARKAAHGGDG
jgi:hypothetical protein